MSNNKVTKTDTFRLAFTRRKTSELFKSPMVKAVLLTELRKMGSDAEMIVKLLDKVHPVKLVQLPRQQQAANANVVQPYDVANTVHNPPPRPQDRSSEETTLDVLDSDDELVNDLGLNQRQEQRLRRKRKKEGEKETVAVQILANKHFKEHSSHLTLFIYLLFAMK